MRFTVLKVNSLQEYVNISASKSVKAEVADVVSNVNIPYSDIGFFEVETRTLEENHENSCKFSLF